jgi:peroxiredoxin
MELTNMRLRALVILLVVSLVVSFSAVCKKGSPTSPEIITFRGSIAMGNQRLANVRVYLSWDESQSTLTDANGEFRFTGFTGSYFIITPSQPGYAFSPSNYELGSQSRDDLAFAALPASYGSIYNEIAADFSAKNQSDQNVSLYGHFGKVILIDFSADWCGPCRDEAGRLESLFQNYKNKGFQVLTILISGSAAVWADTYKLTFPVLDDTSEGLWNVYGEGYVPLNIILDRNMTIRYKAAGFNESVIIDRIKKYL